MPDESNTAVAEPDAATRAVQAAFDKILPPPREPAPVEPRAPDAQARSRDVAPVPPPEPEAPPKPAAKETPAADKEPTGRVLPAFLQKQPESTAAAASVPAPVPAAEDWPEEPPGGAKDQKAKDNWNRFRTEYQSRGSQIGELNKKVADLEARSKAVPEDVTKKISALEQQNQQLLAFVERYQLQSSPRFIAEFEQPRINAAQLAQRIVTEAGGDVESLNRALAATGKAHYDIMEEVNSSIPESAKLELGAVVKDIRAWDARREQFLADPKRALEVVRRQDIEAQQKQIETNQKAIESQLDMIFREMEDVHHVEVFQRTTDPKEAWWNEQAETVKATARDVLKSPDQRRLVAAVALGATADVYRQLFLNANERAQKAESELAAIKETEPDLGGIGGGMPSSEREKEELAKPFAQVFLDRLKKNRNR